MCDDKKTSDMQDITIRISIPKMVQHCSCCNQSDKTNEVNNVSVVVIPTTTNENGSSVSSLEDALPFALGSDSTKATELVVASVINQESNIVPIIKTVEDVKGEFITVPGANGEDIAVLKAIPTPEEKAPKRKKKSIFKTIYISALIGALALPAIVAVYFGLSFQTVISASMAPTIHPGDMLISKVVAVKKVHTGDIILLLDSASGLYRSHRVASITRGDVNTTIVTRGDANGNLDAPVLVTNNSLTRRVVAVIPKVGFITNALDKTKVKLGILGAFVLLGVVNLVSLFFRRFRSKKKAKSKEETLVKV